MIGAECHGTDSVLSLFRKRVASAGKHDRHDVVQRGGLEKRPELPGGGLMRSLGGWKALTSLRRIGLKLKRDERILGDGDCVPWVRQGRECLFHVDTEGESRVIVCVGLRVSPAESSSIIPFLPALHLTPWALSPSFQPSALRIPNFRLAQFSVTADVQELGGLMVDG